MTPLNTFVRAVRDAVRVGVGTAGIFGVYAGRGQHVFRVKGRWRGYLYVCRVYPDGSAQLLSRDEDECLLFATLWELEK